MAQYFCLGGPGTGVGLPILKTAQKYCSLKKTMVLYLDLKPTQKANIINGNLLEEGFYIKEVNNNKAEILNAYSPYGGVSV